MEEIKNGEQLEETVTNVQNSNVEDIGRGTLLSSETGSLGKFKDADSLLSAYNSLQAEFTRKCQKLSEVSKRLEEKTSKLESEQTALDNEIEPSIQDGAETDNENTGEENDDIESASEKKSNKVFLNSDWKEKVEAFLADNTKAQKYSKEIADEILKDESLQASPSALELAWARVMQKNYAEPDVLARDQTFIKEKILTSEEIKQQVLEEYFKNLNKNKTPIVIGGGGSVASVKQAPPQNMYEAKQAVEKLFNLRG